jgi:nucleoid DNA-binding protein
MDKPISLSMKDYLIRRLAVKLMTSEKTIEAVINHQFQSANEALLNNKTIEISGFGKFIFNDKKAFKKMSKYKDIQRAYQRHLENPELSENKRRVTELKLQSVTEAINTLKPKIINESVVTDI